MIDPLAELKKIIIRHSGCDHYTEDHLFHDIVVLCQNVDKQREHDRDYLHNSIIDGVVVADLPAESAQIAESYSTPNPTAIPTETRL